MTESTAFDALGYSPRWQALFEPYAAAGLSLARVVKTNRGSMLVATEADVLRAKPSPAFLKAADGLSDLPAVGDWVAVLADRGVEIPLIEAVLPRTSAITRGDPGGTSGIQVLAANIDTVFVVHPLADEPNLRRIERELALAWDSGAVPVVVLTKADLSADADAAREQVEAIAPDTDVLVTSVLAEGGAGPLLPYLAGHRTAVLVGPSGAGKSTLVNSLLGEDRQATSEVRVSDGRGRHTTVARELIVMPNGGVLIDTPGLRALGLTGSEDGISSAFPEIDEASRSCRFRDCSHVDEPGCAVRAAVDDGTLSAERLANYLKLVREAQVAAAKTDARLRVEEERKGKTIAKASKEYFKRFSRG